MRTLYCLLFCSVLLALRGPLCAQPARTSDSLELVRLYHLTDGDNWISNKSWLSDEPISQWVGVVTKTVGEGENTRTVVRHLYLVGQEISTALPDRFNLPDLDLLSLENNDWTGAIPDFEGMPKLRYLTLSSDEITGPIPDFSHMPNLRDLRIKRKTPSTLPDFSNMPELRSIFMFSS